MFPNNNDFDRDFAKQRDNFDRNFKKAAAGIGIAWVVSAILSFAFLIALAWVAYHFISKVW